ncbi:MAG: hypothetical protein SOZ46_04245 [Bullifex sp.]|nr:hypothetical protein [Spirochaetales bacterium]MDY3850008.1 hypothetical protein [Bullifex sp.]MDY5777494.1 hypothetical protein [Bullifex sp.]
MVNRSLKARYEALKQREELYEVRLKALERQRDSLSEDSALDDLALRLGYNREGEKVFYFETPDETENVRTYADDPLPETYKGICTWILLLVSAGLTIPVAVIVLLCGRKKEGFEEEGAERNYNEDYDF